MLIQLNQFYTYSEHFMVDIKNINTSKQNQTIKELDAITRKPLDQQGCKKLVSFVKDTDISYIQLLISTAENYLAPAFYIWPKYELKIGTHVSSFMNIVYSKIVHGKVDQLKIIFQRLKEKYQRSTRKRVTLLDETQIKMFPTDNKLKSFVSQCEKARKQSENDRRSVIVQQEQKQQMAATIVAANKDLGANYLQSRICVLKEMYYKAKLANQRPEKRQEEMKLVLKLEDRHAISRDCINCISFVYEDEDLSFPMSGQPVTYFGRILSVGNMIKDILQQIVSYLNGKGGILIIGAQKVDNRVVPIVQEMAEFNKEKQKDRIQTSLGLISPSVTLNKQVELEYIPIADNSRKHPQNTQPVWKQNGACILRITVIPTEPQKTFYYAVPSSNQIEPSAQIQQMQAQNTSQSSQAASGLNVFSRNTEIGDEQLKNQAIYEFMKQRYREYDPSSRQPDFVLRDRGNYLPCLIRHIDRCRPPQKGNPYYGDMSYYEDISKKKENQSKSTNPLLQGNEHYKNISLLVVNSNLVQKITGIFKNEEKLQSQIKEAFPIQKFKLSHNTFLVFHNCKFQKLKNGINKSKAALKSQNDKKEVLLISTLPTLAFDQSKLTHAMQRQLQKKAIEQANEKIQFKLIQNVIYVKCISIITAVYLYFYLHNNHSLKGTFQKIPQGSVTKSKLFKHSSRASKIPAKNDKRGDVKGSKYTNEKGNIANYSGYNRELMEEDEDYLHQYSDQDFDDQYSKGKQNSPNKKNNAHGNANANGNGKKYEEPVAYNNSYYSENNNGNYYDYTKEEEIDESNSYNATNTVIASYGSNQYSNYLSQVPMQQKAPNLVYVQNDAFGNRYDYYDNSVVYLFDMYGNYVSCQYYQTQ